MRKLIRILIAIIVVLSLVVLARNESAWAAKSTAGTGLQAQPALLQDKHDCEGGQDGDKCKDKDKDKDKCKKHKDNCGTVKPPDDDIKVCKNGSYSVGGAAIVEVKNLGENRCLEASTTPADAAVDKSLSSSTFVSNVLNLRLPKQNTNVKVCFAAPPGKQMKIYASSQDTWNPVKTTLKNGIACAQVSGSGYYALIGK